MWVGIFNLPAPSNHCPLGLLHSPCSPAQLNFCGGLSPAWPSFNAPNRHVSPAALAGVDLTAVARMTPGMSGADLANLLNEGAIVAARENKCLGCWGGLLGCRFWTMAWGGLYAKTISMIVIMIIIILDMVGIIVIIFFLIAIVVASLRLSSPG